MNTPRAEKYWIGLEAGGTKFVCVAARSADHVLERVTLPTQSPAQTLSAVNAFIERCKEAFGEPQAIGVAAFGPIEINPSSARYGTVLDTPKVGWTGVCYLKELRCNNIPVFIDTDVNAAALAEAHWSPHDESYLLSYVTVGTGIGAGFAQAGESRNGITHSEFGHLRPQRAPGDDFPGICPYHESCFEGLASGPAVKARYGKTLSALGTTHPGRQLEAFYLGQLCAAIFFSHAPETLVLGGGVMGGGVMDTDSFLGSVRAHAQRFCGGYGPWQDLEERIVAPHLGTRSGSLGALHLAGMT